MDTPTRPVPIGAVRHDRYFDTAEVAAYRMARGVSQEEVARFHHKQQSYVSTLETSKMPEIIQAKVVVEILDAVDQLAGRRRTMMATGRMRLHEIRGQDAKPAANSSRRKVAAETVE